MRPEIGRAERASTPRRAGRRRAGHRGDRHRRARRHPGRRVRPEPALPGRRRARLGQDDAGAAVPARGRGPRRAGAVRHALGDGGGARRRVRSHGWSLDGITIRELAPAAESLEPDEQYTMFHPSEVELSRDDADDPRRRRAPQADAHGLRLAVGAAPAGRQPAALPPADPGAQAVLRRPRVHGAAARRPDRDRARPAGAEHRARRDPARAAASRVRRGAAAAARASSTAACASAAATTTTSSARGGLEVFPRLVAAEHRQLAAREQLAQRHRRRSTSCSAAASSAARAR